MPKSVRIIDNFLPVEIYAAHKRASLAARYEKIRFRNLDYRGMCNDESFNPAPLFARHGMHIRLQYQFFRIYEKDAIQNTFIHWDTGLASYAAILSLAENDRHNGHFAFWRHRETGWEEVDLEDSAGVALTDADGLIEDRWELTELIELSPNRCVIFSTRHFHSRYPKIWQEPWPRRIKVFSFDLEGDTQLDPAWPTKEIDVT